MILDNKASIQISPISRKMRIEALRKFIIVALSGVEPEIPGPKSDVLPLHHSAVLFMIYAQQYTKEELQIKL